MTNKGTRTESNRAHYTPDEAAERAGVSRQLIYRGIKSDQIPHIRLGKRIIIPKTAFDGWLETCGGQYRHSNFAL